MQLSTVLIKKLALKIQGGEIQMKPTLGGTAFEIKVADSSGQLFMLKPPSNKSWQVWFDGSEYELTKEQNDLIDDAYSECKAVETSASSAADEENATRLAELLC